VSKDILGEYGNDSSQPQAGRATHGGVMPVKPCDYSPPVGPTNINDGRSAGLHGSNHGNSGTQGRH
jgi:hypothetical protein